MTSALAPFVGDLSDQWVLDKVESVASNILGVPVRVGSLDMELFRSRPSLTLSTITAGSDSDRSPLARIDRVRVSVEAGSLFTGDFVLGDVSVEGARVALQVSAQGKANWAAVGGTGTAGQASPGEASTALPSIRDLSVEPLFVTYTNRQTGDRLHLDATLNASTMQSGEASSLSASGAANGVPLSLDLTTSTLGGIVDPGVSTPVDAEVNLGDNRLAARGSLTDVVGLSGIDLNVDMLLRNPDQLSRASGVALPGLAVFSARGRLTDDKASGKTDGETIYVMNRITGRYGQTDFNGDLRITPGEDPIRVYATLGSETLHLDELLPSDAGGQSDEVNGPTDARSNRRVLPDTPLNLAPLLQTMNGAIRYQADAVRASSWPINALDLRLEIEGQRMLLKPAAFETANGRISGSLNLEATAAGISGVADLDMAAVHLPMLLARAGLNPMDAGDLDGRAKIWFEGNSVAELAASADGGLFLLMTGGRVDSLLLELAGIDVAESLVLLLDPRNSSNAIRCAFVDLLVDDGSATLGTFAFDTSDTLFLGEGTIDFNDESLALRIEPHPRDVSIFDLPLMMEISGTFKAPEIWPARESPVRLATAAVLGAVSSPFVAVFSLLQAEAVPANTYCSTFDASLITE